MATIEMLAEPVRTALSNPTLLAIWVAIVVLSLGVLLRDLRRVGGRLSGLMRMVWVLVVTYSGPFGLAMYWWAGRPGIPRDSLLRRGIRSTAHCYSGCGAGEITGLLVAGPLLGLTLGWVAAVTFAFAFLFGYSLTVGPLLQDGVAVATAIRDALYSETASIAVMEVVAIAADLFLAGEAGILDPLFWGSLVFSLSLGFVAATPVNVALVKLGVKEGMSNPAEA
ncbi:MAG: DUF4396 domain-containing protein [Halobacteriaceae archaeon]